ncbi:4'-phosphopantetheinyl transferase superfamily protein [Rhodobacterales bacterium HKCCE3408]|nr:4'-phosphopantetheinyl transferase superfamily protein [Rhodobacterales bacterium HKCCE3408]
MSFVAHISEPEICVSGIAVHGCALDDDRDVPLSVARDLLSEDERARAARFHFARDADRFVRGRAFLRRALANATGIMPGAISFAYGDRLKPELAGGSVAFNKSDSRDLAVVAVSHVGPVGIDLEFLDRELDHLSVARSCMTEHEREVLSALDPAARAVRFFEFWTAKEAFMKLTGQGMYLDPKGIHLVLADDGSPIGFPDYDGHTVRLDRVDLDRPATICTLASLDATADSRRDAHGPD